MFNMIIILLYIYVKIREENIHLDIITFVSFFFTNIKQIIEAKKILKTEINSQ